MAEQDQSKTGSTLLWLLQDPKDQEAWARFVVRYGPKVHDWCRRWGLQESDAQDVTQEVLLKLCNKIGGFAYDPAKGSFRGWLKTLAHHAWRDSLDSRQRRGLAAGGSEIQEQLLTVAAHDDLAKRLEEEFDHELMAMAAERSPAGSLHPRLENLDGPGRRAALGQGGRPGTGNAGGHCTGREEPGSATSPGHHPAARTSG